MGGHVDRLYGGAAAIDSVYFLAAGKGMQILWRGPAIDSVYFPGAHTYRIHDGAPTIDSVSVYGLWNSRQIL